jgi:transcriptional regulator with XRE-family HTH domain
MIRVTATLGELLRAARAEKGWDQAQFATHLGTVSQQTVSRWERGVTRPRKSMIPDIAEVLDIDGGKLLDAMTGTQSPSAGPDLPVRPLLSELPLGMLAEDVFERFSVELAEQLYTHPDVVHGYGSRGDKQFGIDVEVRHQEGPPTGIQCKRTEEFGPADVREAVKALTLDVRECIIFLSRRASPGARQEITKHPGWQLWDRIDLSRKVRSLPDEVAAIRLVDSYFPGYREAFLGIRKPSPWETTEAFFRPLSSMPVFSHDRELVGRDRELDSLTSLFQDPARRIALVVGPGGIGKSRLVCQFGLDMSQPGTSTVLFAAADTPVEPAQFEELPRGGQLAVVVEDAHARSDAAAIAQGVLRLRPDARLVISVRPYALANVQNALRRVGIFPDDCLTVAVDELSVPDAVILARAALGENVRPGLAEWLGSIAPDCPLIVVVAAALISRGSVDPARLHASDRIRMEIMQAFRDAMTAGVGTGDPDMRREVLNTVAAFQPFRIDDTKFQAAMAAVTQRPFDQLVPYLNALEDAQVLQRRGTSLRIVPDLLGDAILAAASIHTGSGTITGYLGRALRAADGAALMHLFVNGSRVDWQVRHDRIGENSLVDPLWLNFQSEFAASGADDRYALLAVVKKVAAFQPVQTLGLVRWALSHPVGDAGPDDHAAGGLPGFSDQDVRNELAPLLENVAYNFNHLGDAADLLWQLAMTDTRKPNQFPEHPIRVLSRLMEYAPTTPLSYHEGLLSVAARWLDQPHAADLPYSPFDVLDVLLATEAVVQSSDGLSLTMRSYRVAPEVVRKLRGKVINLAFAELRSTDIRRAVRAARTIGVALIGPGPAFNRVPDQEEKDRWIPGFVAIINRIGVVGADTELDPVVVIALREALRWHYQHSSTDTRVAAQEVWRALPDTAEHRLALVLHDSWGTLLGDDEGSAYHQEEKDRLFAAVVADITGEWPVNELVDRLEQRLIAERLAFGNAVAHSGFFVWTLTQENPPIADELCSRVIQDRRSILRDLIPAALGRLLETQPTEGLARTRELLNTEDLELVRCVANALSWGRGRRASLLDGEADLLRSLIRHDDPIIRTYAIAAGRPLSQEHLVFAAELITTVRFADSPKLADEVAAAFTGRGYLRWGDLPDKQARAIISQLTDCSSIDDYHVNMLIAEICDQTSDIAADLLMRRVEIWEQTENVLAYDPLPHLWHHRPRFEADQQYGGLLRRVHRWMASSVQSWRRQHAGSELFALIAGSFGQEALGVLQEALASGDTAQVKAVGSILRNAPRTLLWDQVDFISLALRIAQQYGHDTLQAVGGGLHALAITGMRHGTPGQPFAEDTEQREKSAEILAQLPRKSVEAEFYQALVESAEHNIRWEAELEDKLTSRRDW